MAKQVQQVKQGRRQVGKWEQVKGVVLEVAGEDGLVTLKVVKRCLQDMYGHGFHHNMVCELVQAHNNKVLVGQLRKGPLKDVSKLPEPLQEAFGVIARVVRAEIGKECRKAAVKAKKEGVESRMAELSARDIRQLVKGSCK